MSDPKNQAYQAKRLIVVDDHILFREGLVNLFKSTPEYEVVGQAGSVFDCIENVKLLRPDMVIMDFSLPDGTGLDAMSAVLSIVPECTVVFLTAHEEDEKLFAAIRAGASGYLPKNVAGSDLLSSLKALEKDEMAITRKFASRIIEEFSNTNKQTTIHDEIFTKLSPRELDVLQELRPGSTNLQIAKKLHISENTVKHHLRNILMKLEVDNRREAGLIAMKAGITSTDSPISND